jgi:hypothetical protein
VTAEQRSAMVAAIVSAMPPAASPAEWRGAVGDFLDDDDEGRRITLMAWRTATLSQPEGPGVWSALLAGLGAAAQVAGDVTGLGELVSWAEKL